MKERKRIGLLVGQPEENYQKLFIEGFLEQAFTYDYDVCVFAMYQKYQESAAREIGESNIFSLIQYDLFDAFVVLLDTLQTPGVADEIEDNLKKHFNGPVLCVDKESKYFPTIMTDHYSPIIQLISHLIEHHGFKDIAFLTGKKWHIHSKQRLQGFYDCMEQHGLEVGENRVFYGDFWYNSGDSMVEKLLKDRKHLPEAIACANDCMAIGVAEALEKNGIHVPEDIAVIGYDSIEEGRKSPKPITSAPIPARECGKHVANCITAMFEGLDLSEFKTEVEMFIGSSCGCHNDSIVPKLDLRPQWATDISAASYYSCFNHIMEDMLSQSDFKNFMNTVFSYVYQIREFDSFHLCLNEFWNQQDAVNGRAIIPKGYTNRMLHVLKCGPSGAGLDKVNFEETFNTNTLLPELYEERDVPKAFIFTPLHFEDRGFGYAVLSYGNEPKSYNDTYRLWLRSVMQGLECFRRVEALQKTNETMQASQIRDALTGLFNYRGFVDNSRAIIERARENNQYISAMALDLNGLNIINDTYGRKEGDRAIIKLSQMIEKCIDEDGISCRLGNDEFVVAEISNEDNRRRIHFIREKLYELLEQHNNDSRNLYQLSISTGSMTNRINNTEDMERLVSDAVSQKNGNKVSEQKMRSNTELSEEEIEEAKVVRKILDENLFLYHFQPIVSAKTGEIYAYEALMRADVQTFISPLNILKYAEHFNRLYDVEKATFFNVLKCIDNCEEAFAGKHVFVNSIPGNQLNGEEGRKLEELMSKRAGMLVVELTEQTEADDEELSQMKARYEKIGIETAVDDYGTGYSNITNLLRYMPNYVKIDRMLLTEIQNNPQKQHFVKDIIEFAHDNDFMALAEGIETAEELKTVIRLGVDLIQGYYTARPEAEIVPSINIRITNEILQYNQREIGKSGDKIYVAGKENRVSLVKLAIDKYTQIQVVHEKLTYRDITVIGVPGFQSNICLQIKDGYQGRIVLNNISFAGAKNRPCIELGDNCEVTFALEGDNELRTGGIRVPKSSKVTFEGIGNLSITENNVRYFGIGNTLEDEHGDLYFEQDGTIEIYGNGMKGIGIGSGLGGNIAIRRGKYVLRLNGQEGVGIGAAYADVDIEVLDCDMEINVGTSKGVGIGSIDKCANIRIENVSVRCILGGAESVAFGSINGESGKISIKNANLDVNLRARKLCGFGVMYGDTEIEIQYASVQITGEGKEALAIGNQLMNAKIRILNSDVDTKLKTNLTTDIGAKIEDIYIANGRCKFMLNGKVIERRVEDADL